MQLVDLLEITVHESRVVLYEVYQGDFMQIINPNFHGSQRWIEQHEKQQKYPGWLPLRFAKYALVSGKGPEATWTYIVLEDEDGNELLRWLNDQFPDCQVVTTGHVLVDANS